IQKSCALESMWFDALLKEVLYGCGYDDAACNSKRSPRVDRDLSTAVWWLCCRRIQAFCRFVLRRCCYNVVQEFWRRYGRDDDEGNSTVELHDNSDSFGDGDRFPLVHVIFLLLA